MRVVAVGSLIVAAGSLTLVGCSSSESSSGDPTTTLVRSTSTASTLATDPTASIATSTTVADSDSATPASPGLEFTELIGYEDDRDVADVALAVLQEIGAAPSDEVLTPVAAGAIGGAELLPAGATMKVRRPTWERRGRLAAVVIDVQLAGTATPDEFVAFLVATEDGWRLSHTERLSP